YLHDEKPAPIHLSAKEAGAAARAAGARQLMLTHLWPLVARQDAIAEGSAAYGAPVLMAEAGQTTTI
ncbi:MAG TPA: MBL fold metallo-hydrolase, partial [Acidimicrobiia bacterium]|nr:MBL fold metallo-hydrolase [Acidimicrobiia bacterium]